MRARYSDYEDFIKRKIREGYASTDIIELMGVGNNNSLVSYVRNKLPKKYLVKLLKSGEKKIKMGKSKFTLSYSELDDWLLEYRTLNEYADKMEIRYDSLRKKIKRELPQYAEEIFKRSQSNTNTNKLRDRIKELGIDFDEEISKGTSFTSLGKEYGIAQQTLRKYVEKFRPDIFEKFVENGETRRNNSNLKVTDSDVELMISYSNKGMGIEAISKFLPYDSTTIRNHLIKNMGEEYYKNHDISKFSDNNGWNGKRIEYNGEEYQSMQEVIIAKILHELELDFKPHTRLKIGNKIFYPDFYLPQLDIFIEYAGMLDRAFYRNKFAKKISEYSMENIKCLVVVPETIGELEGTLKEMMPYVTKS